MLTLSKDIKFLISGFLSIYVRHVRRMGNCVAHKLARRAIVDKSFISIDGV